MIKYLNTEVVFREFPDEITLAINITNCPFKCEECHSPELRENIGTILDMTEISRLINENEGITCVGFMGGDNDPSWVNVLAHYIKDKYSNLKVGWYSGRDSISDYIDKKYFDYIKVGPYIKEKGPLDNPNTNQIMYKVLYDPETTFTILKNITYKFWKNGK